MELEEAIKILNLYRKINDKRAIPLTKEELKFKLEEDFTQKVSEAIQVVLKELDKKDKVIDEMLKILARNELGHYKGEYGSYERFNKEDWKEYIYKKVEEQE